MFHRYQPIHTGRNDYYVVVWPLRGLFSHTQIMSFSALLMGVQHGDFNIHPSDCFYLVVQNELLLSHAINKIIKNDVSYELMTSEIYSSFFSTSSL